MYFKLHFKKSVSVLCNSKGAERPEEIAAAVTEPTTAERHQKPAGRTKSAAEERAKE
jgi:hypothetical protein